MSLEGGHRHRHGKVGLSRARRPHAKGDGVRANGLHVAALADRLWPHLPPVMAENHAARALAAAPRPMRHLADEDVDLVGGGNLSPLDSLDELREDRGRLLDLLRRANDEDLVAADDDHRVLEGALDAAQVTVSRTHEGRGVNGVGNRKANSSGFHAPPGLTRPDVRRTSCAQGPTGPGHRSPS